MSSEHTLSPPTLATSRLYVKKLITLVPLGGLAAFLAIELGLQLTGYESLCGSDACSIAADTIMVPTPWLYSVAIGWALLCIYLKLSTHHFWTYTHMLCTGLAFEGVLLGFLARTGIPCTLCLTVAGFLAAVVLVQTVEDGRIGLLGILVWTAAMSGSMVLSQSAGLTTFNGALVRSALMQVMPEGEEGPRPITSPREYHLYVRYNCPHCAHLIEQILGGEMDKYGKWYIHTPYHRPGEREARLNAFVLQHKDMGLEGVLLAKGMSTENLPEVPAAELERFSQLSRWAAEDLDRFGLQGVPAMVIQDGTTKTVLEGADKVWLLLRHWGIIHPKSE